MHELYDIPAFWIAVVVVAALLFFAPSIIALRRRVRAFPSISALNALMMLTLLIGSFGLRWFLWTTATLWVLATAWATLGRRRDA